MGLIRKHIGEDFKTKVSRWMTESGYSDFLYKEGCLVTGVSLDSDLKINFGTKPGANNTIRFLAQHPVDLPIYIVFKMPRCIDVRIASWQATGPAQVLAALNKHSRSLEGLQWVDVIKGENQVVFEKKNGEWVKTHQGKAYLY